MTESVLEVIGVTKKVRGRTLVDDVSFAVKKGEICGFLGPNGAGKTTLIRLLTGLIVPTSGELRIAGVNVQKERKTALGKIGAMVESPVFFPYLSGRKNLLNLARLHPELKGKRAREERVKDVLSLVGLAGRGDDKVGTYSLGMKQRLGIAQALLGRPEVVILDEPANGLDPLGMRELRELILSLRDQFGLTFFVSSHLLDELQQICSRLVVIREGKLLWQGETRELVLRAGADGRLEDAFVELVRG
ncbi:ABC transporter ATP-binding protein [Tumebacillus sp. DT12]|uniref:ABC transporter ATP-binding protein n=1 Tax=Tumebacillus lacus TaxID=2995335 RepID=A0ABT3X155_9BACL|nr:ABC transporter ATP-binding protein [Tumebacillus lacus]MCX7569346.1 ABC transporter ATP-binding protein [Tumebacillus lacus]